MNEELYALLPAAHRARDLASGGALRALLSVLEQDLDALRGDVDQLYEELFIETASEQLVPYIGDLLGVRPLHAITERTHSLRAYVANTLGYRRRKGTAAVLEQLARDLTGWPCRVVELFRQIGWSQHLAHVRPDARTLDLRSAEALERVGGPFEGTTRTLDVRRFERGQVRHNLPNVALFLWMLPVFELVGAEAEEVSERRYRIHPRGVDAPLYNVARTEPTISHLAEETHVPARLRRRPLYDELEALRRAKAMGQAPPRARFFPEAEQGQPVVEVALVYESGIRVVVLPEEMVICNLEGEPEDGGWRLPPATLKYAEGTEGQRIRVGVDPANGRIALPAEEELPRRVLVSHAYAAGSTMGGGPYDREDVVEAILQRWWAEDDRHGEAFDPTKLFQIGVSRQLETDGVTIFGTLTDAIVAWNDQAPGTCGVIALLESGIHRSGVDGESFSDTPIVMKPGSRLLVVGAEWPQGQDEHGQPAPRVPGELSARSVRPVVRGNLVVEAQPSARLAMVGLFVEGQLRVAATGGLDELELHHCTIVRDRDEPSGPAISIEAGHDRVAVSLERCITGFIECASGASVVVRDCILDPEDDGKALVGGPARVEIEGSTVCGTTSAHELWASNSIFMGAVEVDRRQVGCVRFCYVATGSRAPRRYRCQPDRALEARAAELRLRMLPELERTRVLERVQPRFVSRTLGQPAHARLAAGGPEEIGRGAEDGSEMGAFFHLKQPQREASLRQGLEEYLRFGLQAGLSFVDEESGT